MILLRLNGERVVEVVKMTSPYTPQDNEVLVDKLPPIHLEQNEFAWIYYRDGKIEYEKEVKL